MTIVVTYGLLGVCAVVLAFSVWVGGESGHKRWPRLSRWAIALQLGALLAGYGVLRPGTGDDATATLQTARDEGKATLLEFYSNYCGRCLTIKPSVDGVVDRIDGKMAFAKVNVSDAEGGKLASRYGVRALPTFVVVESDGEVSYRIIGDAPQFDKIKSSFSDK